MTELQHRDVLDHGYIKLLRIDGDDNFIAETARTSTDTSSTVQKNMSLVNRLVRDRHTSPVEFVGVVVQIQMPIFVARQWMRHRTGPFNEFSLRYSEAVDCFYVPETERCQVQSTFNKQGSAEAVDPELAKWMRQEITDTSVDCFRSYTALRDKGLTRELARMVLPTNYYTKVRWKIDLHNLMHFMMLREDSHAQWEIQQYAKVMHEYAKLAFPKAVESFENNIQNRQVISKQLATLLAQAVDGISFPAEVQSELNEFLRRN